MGDESVDSGEPPATGQLAPSRRGDFPLGIPVPGEIIAAKYEIERAIGAGGMGIALAARHMQLGQRVAIKFMREDAAREGLVGSIVGAAAVVAGGIVLAATPATSNAATSGGSVLLEVGIARVDLRGSW